VINDRGRREKKWGRSPLDLLGLLPFFVSKCYRTRRISERGRGGWLGLSPGRFCQKGEKKRRKKEDRRPFGQDLFKF
jgi:hypothetical protein